jgi:hypothetical protein
MGEGREGVDGSSEVEGRKCEGRDTIVWGANDAMPCGRACVCSGPISEKLAMYVCLLAEESKCMSVIIC